MFRKQWVREEMQRMSAKQQQLGDPHQLRATAERIVDLRMQKKVEKVKRDAQLSLNSSDRDLLTLESTGGRRRRTRSWMMRSRSKSFSRMVERLHFQPQETTDKVLIQIQRQPLAQMQNLRQPRCSASPPRRTPLGF